MSAPFIVLAIVLLTAAGDYFLKVASSKDTGHFSPEFLLGAALYMLTAAGFLLVMRHMSLASIGVWYSVLTILFMTALGVVVFDEAISRREIAGILMAFGALGLMNRVA